MYQGGQRLLRAASPAGSPQPRPERHSKTELPADCFCRRHDFNVNSEVAAKWFARVKAPSNEFVWFENSAHLPMTEEPGRFLVVRYAHPIERQVITSAANRLMSQTIRLFSDFQRFQVFRGEYLRRSRYSMAEMCFTISSFNLSSWLQCRSRWLYSKADFTSFGRRSFLAQTPR